MENGKIFLTGNFPKSSKAQRVKIVRDDDNCFDSLIPEEVSGIKCTQMQRDSNVNSYELCEDVIQTATTKKLTLKSSVQVRAMSRASSGDHKFKACYCSSKCYDQMNYRAVPATTNFGVESKPLGFRASFSEGTSAVTSLARYRSSAATIGVTVYREMFFSMTLSSDWDIKIINSEDCTDSAVAQWKKG